MGHRPWWRELPCLLAALLWEPIYLWRKWRLRL